MPSKTSIACSFDGGDGISFRFSSFVRLRAEIEKRESQVFFHFQPLVYMTPCGVWGTVANVPVFEVMFMHTANLLTSLMASYLVIGFTLIMGHLWSCLQWKLVASCLIQLLGHPISQSWQWSTVNNRKDCSSRSVDMTNKVSELPK